MIAIKRLKASPNTITEISGDVARVVLVNGYYNIIFSTGTNPQTVSANTYDVFTLRAIQPDIL